MFLQIDYLETVELLTCQGRFDMQQKIIQIQNRWKSVTFSIQNDFCPQMRLFRLKFAFQNNFLQIPTFLKKSFRFYFLKEMKYFIHTYRLQVKKTNL